METKTNSPAGNSLIYGLITGGAMIIIMLILMLANLYLKPGVNYVIYVAVIAGMVLGTINFRTKFCGGYLTYGGAFFSSFLIGLFSSILYILFFFIYIEFIDPSFIDQMMEIARQKMEESTANMTEEQMEQAMSMSAKFMSPVMMTIFGFLGNLIASTVIALIVAIFTKKTTPVQPIS